MFSASEVWAHNNGVLPLLGVTTARRVGMVRFYVLAHLSASAVLDGMNVAIGDVPSA
jgi:hypothetical protein